MRPCPGQHALHVRTDSCSVKQLCPSRRMLVSPPLCGSGDSNSPGTPRLRLSGSSKLRTYQCLLRGYLKGHSLQRRVPQAGQHRRAFRTVDCRPGSVAKKNSTLQNRARYERESRSAQSARKGNTLRKYIASFGLVVVLETCMALSRFKTFNPLLI